MAKRSSGKLWLGVGAGVAVVGGAILFAARSANAASQEQQGSGPPGDDPQKAAADAKQADAAFAAMIGAAATAAVALVPASAPYVGVATPIVAAGWKSQPVKTRAGVWSGAGPVAGVVAQAAPYVAAGASAAASQSAPSESSSSSTDGFAGAPSFGAAPRGKKGPLAVLAWATNRFVYELKKAMRQLGKVFCANADKVYKELLKAGAALPKQSKWDALSCDQKLAFVAALGPWGVGMLAGGALLGGFASDAAGQFKKWGPKAGAAVADLSKKLGVKVPDIGGAVSSLAKSVGLGALDAHCEGCRGEPLPSANLPGTTFVTAAGHPPRPHAANVRTQDVSPVKFGVV